MGPECICGIEQIYIEMWASVREKGTRAFCYDKKHVFMNSQKEIESVVRDEWWRERKFQEKEGSWERVWLCVPIRSAYTLLPPSTHCTGVRVGRPFV
jgi:hypothetical protein